MKGEYTAPRGLKGEYTARRGRLLRVIGEDEIASGRVTLAASDGNMDHIYELAIIGGKKKYRTAWRIVDGEAQRVPDVEWLNCGFTPWETEWTIRLDKTRNREERLKELGI